MIEPKKTEEKDGFVQMKSNLLATMSHEMRTPMQSVFGFLELMLLEQPTDRIKNMIEQAMMSASGVLEILDDILDVAKIDADKMILDRFEIPVRTLVRGVLEALEPKIAQKDVQLLDDVALDVPPVVIGDPKRLRQILINLAGNAVKFTAQGHVTLRVSVAEQNPLRLLFEVSDTGIGISDDVQKKLFAPFTQADSSTSREFGGTGLGLSICRKLVELMGGKIGVTSEVGQGTNFWFNIPMAEMDEDISGEPFPDLAGLTVLSVEDHPQAAREIVSTLSSMGARVESCKSAGEAKSILAYRPFDVVMSDQSLSDGLLGLDVIRYVADRWPQSGLVMYTARDDSGMRQSLQSLGAVYLEKPASRRGLGEAVAKVAAHQISDCSDGNGKILVVEDTDSVREMFRRQFEILGADADYAANGAEALALMEAHRYHLVLTDLHMPRMDGYGLIKNIRSNEDDSQHLPVVLLTADIQLAGYRSYMPLGFDECLLKPVSLGVLRQMLIRWGVPIDKARQELPKTFQSLERKKLYDKILHEKNDDEDDLGYFSLDLDVLKEQMGELNQSAIDMLAQFPKMMLPLIETMKKVNESGDYVALKEVAHSLKGAARSAGAMALGNLAAELQTKAESGERDAGLCVKISQEFSLVVRDIASLKAGAF
ncbi:MAG: response regulator [Alphaproteobacteria bacterium]|jgi:two-component system sensor histidine kinase/response regulator|nr:response regulator [Alphaproteobacteria bacterium]